MAAWIELANFIRLNKANLVTTYTRLLTENWENGQTSQPTDHQSSAQTLLETVVEACEAQNIGLLSQLFERRTTTSSQPAPQKNTHLSLFLLELECLDQTLTPTVTSLEAGKFLWQMLSEARVTILCLLKSPSTSASTVLDTFVVNNAETQYPLSQDKTHRYYSLFEDSPISLWEEDFSAVKNKIERLKSEGVTDFRTYFDAHPETVAECTRLVNIIDVNQATLALYHADSKEEFFAELEQVFTEESFDAFQEELIAIAEGRTKLKVEAVNNTLDGKSKFIELTWSVPPGYEATLSKVFVSIVDITEHKLLDQQIRESLVHRTRQIETSTQVAQAIASAPALDELFSRVVHLVQEEFGYYHAHVYTLEQGYLVMQEGTGEAGRQLKAENHKIALAAKHSLVARAARSGEPILISDVSQEPAWMSNPLLPDTQSELAVPIRLRDQVLGVLDVQSDALGGLNEEDQLLLMGLCGQIATAINHRRIELEREQLLDEAERRVRREQTIREITERMQAAPTLESLVKIAAEELGQRLAAGHALVELGLQPEEHRTPM